ncbi:tripartite tricarboxylate transporter TctB family protein [Donghicola sp. C2-DW-16]|uniref:Tripartite tricarboxylate transporter TctB family protein n=1 Tax=Donghicola mangrovi TaxID=2729614 RepID=A0A850Q7B0_9RHOB|nr:tripartite tricarboxylate transporter TctB family protein [Donghicola mangrovi]NVO24062.1 tripartite tricarboxylate transporter TctB family protein [Donghicola mangrovi]NVO28189.1 tripartite tricarboxylate transporter TctB family protein [Donghicola mangrovi]
MDPEFRGDADHHDGTSDATPGGYADQRRPGELVFAGLMTAGSAALLWNAYGIAGFDALSSPGAIPMATAAVMLVTSVITLVRTIGLQKVAGETLAKDILPMIVLVMFVLLVGFGIALKPVGFLPTAAVFLIISMKIMARRSWPYTFAVALGSLALIWLVFRIVFTVLLPAGIVPESEFIQFFRSLVQAGAK